MEQKPNDSSSKSTAWLSQASAWEMTADLWQSPLYIREKEEKYLAKFKKEGVDKYAARLRNSVPRNKFRESITTMAGMAFRDNPAPEEAPQPIADLFTDIDATGNSLHSFLLNSFELFLRDGGGAIWVKSSPLNEQAREKLATGGTLTSKDREGDKPYWTFVEARQIINHRYAKIGGIDVLTQVTIEMDEIEPVGEFAEEVVKRHYILRPGTFEVRKYDPKEKEFKFEYSGTTGTNEIELAPLAPFGTPPPLLELAMLTVQYYNEKSDFGNWCHYACTPRQVMKLNDISDREKYKDLTQAVDVGIMIAGQHADVKYLEVTGNGIQIAKDNIADTLAEMAQLGVGMLAATEGQNKTASEVLDTAGQRQSKLARYAREFENAVEKAFYFTAEILNAIGGTGKVDLKVAEKSALKLKMDFDRLTFTPERMQIFKDLLANGDISKKTFYEILNDSIDMPDEWTPDIEIERLDEEDAKLTRDTKTALMNAKEMPMETVNDKAL